MKKVYRWAWYNRGGSLTGVFVADASEVEKAIGRDVRFGEVLGKHSDVYGVLERDEFEVVTDDQAFVEAFERFRAATGTNPLLRLAEQDAEDADGED